MSLENLRNALKEKKLKLGTSETLKFIRKSKAKEVFVSSNCPDNLIKDLEKYCEISKCKLYKLKENSKDLGAICKKPFSISMCCSIK
jgi:large subunit ribosomal protein L30e